MVHLFQTSNQDLARLSLEDQQPRAKLLEAGIKVPKALKQELNPIQPRHGGSGSKCVQIRFHVVRIDYEHRIEDTGRRCMVESRVVVEAEALPEPHERRRRSHHRRGWRHRESHNSVERGSSKMNVNLFRAFYTCSNVRWKLQRRGRLLLRNEAKIRRASLASFRDTRP